MKDIRKQAIAVVIVLAIVFSITLCASARLKSWEASADMTDPDTHLEDISIRAKAAIAYDISNFLFLLAGFMALGFSMRYTMNNRPTPKTYIICLSAPSAYFLMTIAGLAVTHLLYGLSIVGKYLLLYAVIVLGLAATANSVIISGRKRNTMKKSRNKNNKKIFK